MFALLRALAKIDAFVVTKLNLRFRFPALNISEKFRYFKSPFAIVYVTLKSSKHRLVRYLW